MLYVGLDVHTKRSSMCILNGDGKIVKQELIAGTVSRVIERLRQITEPFSICYEASCGYGHLYDQIKPLADHIAVAHPGQLRLIFRSKKKHDRVDATKLGKLLYLGEVPAVHVPNINVRSWRKLIEFRQKLLARRVSTKNQIRSILRGHAIASPKGLWTKKGLRWLGEASLPAAEKLAVEMEVDALAEVNGRIKRVEVELAKISSNHPGVTLLMTIPGVGIRTAEAFCAYVDDVQRFARNRQVGTYFGLVPCQDSSAGKDRFGHITKEGPATVRKLLCESAWSCIRYNPAIRAFFERVVKDDPDRRKIAAVATAHHLCRIMAAMLRTGEAWRGQTSKIKDELGPREAAVEGGSPPPRPASEEIVL
jgi:transposase